MPRVMTPATKVENAKNEIEQTYFTRNISTVKKSANTFTPKPTRNKLKIINPILKTTFPRAVMTEQKKFLRK